MTTKPCILCEKPLEPAIEEYGWDHLQPYAGGEIQLIFAFGSCKFDENMNNTVFRAVICDDCAEKLVPHMEKM